MFRYASDITPDAYLSTVGVDIRSFLIFRQRCRLGLFCRGPGFAMLIIRKQKYKCRYVKGQPHPKTKRNQRACLSILNHQKRSDGQYGGCNEADNRNNQPCVRIGAAAERILQAYHQIHYYQR